LGSHVQFSLELGYRIMNGEIRPFSLPNWADLGDSDPRMRVNAGAELGLLDQFCYFPAKDQASL